MNNELTVRSDAATRLHHPFSPSSLQCRENNPCWKSLPDTSSEASERGTMQHDAVDTAEIPAELTDKEAMAVEACKTFFADALAGCPGHNKPSARGLRDIRLATVINEIYVSIDERIITDAAGNEFKGTTGGYLDRAFVSPDGTYAEIFDWKFGAWSVEPAANNVQGISYLLGLVRLFPKLKTVKVHFVMPHRDEVDWHVFTCDPNFPLADFCMENHGAATMHEPQFADLRLRITTIVERARRATELKDFSACKPTAGACLFCGNLAECTSVAAFALKLGKKYAPLQMPENITPSLVIDPANTKARLEAASVMSAWAQAIRAQETAKCIEDENWIPSDYVLRTRKSSKIVDEVKLEAIARQVGLTEQQIQSAKEFSMTPLNKAVRSNAPRGNKDKSEEDFKSALLENGALEEGQPTVWLERLKS